MRDFVPVLVEELERYNNRLDSEEAINNIFADFYVDQNQEILDQEYTFIIRHTTTPKLRAYFDKLANKHNNLLSPEGNMRLRLTLSYPIILSAAEAKAYEESLQDLKEGKRKFFDIFASSVIEPRTIEWIRNELDSDWRYKGNTDNQKDNISKSETTVCKYISPDELSVKVSGRISKTSKDFHHCCLCQQFVTISDEYTVDNVRYYVCKNCKEKYSVLDN